MAWAKSGSKTLDSTASSMTATGLSDNKFNFIITHYEQGSSGNGDLIINGENSSGDYSLRYSNDTGGSSEATSNPSIYTGGGTNRPVFAVNYVCYFSGAEKLVISMGNIADSGAGIMRTLVGKVVAGTSDPITSTAIVDRSGTLNMVSGDNISVLGSDLTPTAGKPTDVQVGSRWEETDTRKMYNYDDEVSSTSASTATTENDNGVNEQVMSSANFEFIGEKVVNSSSALYGLTVNKIGFMMKKREGSPTGTATACVMDSSANILYTFGTVDVSTLPSTYTWTYFTNTLSTYTLTTGNYIGIKYSGGDSSNRIGIYWDNAGSYDGTDSQGSEESGGAWNDRSGQDLRFKIFTGTAFIPKQWSEIGT